MTIKKRLADCSVLGCRLVLILDDLLWVLTDDQLKAALHFADSLSGLLVRATEETQKVKGARKLEVSYIFFKIGANFSLVVVPRTNLAGLQSTVTALPCTEYKKEELD